MVPEIIGMIYEHGVAPAAALICTSLYIQQKIHDNTSDNKADLVEKAHEERYNKQMEALNKIVDNQTSSLEQIRSLQSNTVTLAELSRNLSSDNHNIMALTNTLITDVKILANNQLILTTGFQKVIEQLVAALRD
jgi:hypothetical protein